MSKEKIDVTTCWQITKAGTIGITIPKIIWKELKIKAGDRFLVSYDKKKRVIYEKI